MKIPTIHLNGNSKESLLEEATEALSALDAAEKALHNITIHGRNFYPQGPDAINAALAEYRDLLARFEAIKEEVLAYAVAIDNGGKQNG